MSTQAILDAVVAIAIAIITRFLVPYLSAKLGTEKVKKEATLFDSWVTKATQAVAAAEQFIDKNADKKQFVIDFLTKVGVPEHTLDVVIEAAVIARKVADTTVSTAGKINDAIVDAVNKTEITPVDPIITEAKNEQSI